MHFLLLRLRQIGDVVFTTPALAALKAHFPTSRLVYVVEPAAAPIVANNPHLSEVIVAPRVSGVLGFGRDIELGRRLARMQFDIAIDFHGGPRASLLTWLSRAPRRIGYTVAGRSWMYTELVDRPRALRPRHSVENQWDLLATLGVAPPSRDTFPVEMPVDAEAVTRVASRLDACRLAAGARLVVIHVSAGNPFRRWPIDAFARLAAGLTTIDDSIHVIITSGPSEADAATRVIDDARRGVADHSRHRLLSCGEFSLSELRALVDRAALYIGGDSGPMHVAATSHVPMVSLYGPTLPVRSEPWRARTCRSAAVEVQGLSCRPCDQRVCQPGDFRCLTSITPEQVLTEAERLLADRIR